MLELAGSVAVVTGAGSGIGRASARALADQGARVHVVDIDAQRSADVASEIVRSGGSAFAHVADCSDSEAVRTLAAEVLAAEDGRVDVLHLNAGIGHAGKVEDITLEQWRRVIEVNLWSAVLGLHCFVPSMIERRRGHVVITASGLGLIPAAGVSPYATTKFGLAGLAQSLDAELRSKGVRVTALCPGVVDTDIIRASEFSGDARAERLEAAKFFARRGAAPERVADDILSALRRPRPIVVSPRSHVLPAWILYRIAPGAFLRLAGAIAGRISIVPTSNPGKRSG